MDKTIFWVVVVFMGTWLTIVHELGHFWAGRLLGCKITGIQIGGSGPVLFEFNGKYRWVIRAVPLSGAVFFTKRTQEDADKVRGKNYLLELSGVSRAFTYFAGPFANLVFGFAGVLALAAVYGPSEGIIQAGFGMFVSLLEFGLDTFVDPFMAAINFVATGSTEQFYPLEAPFPYNYKASMIANEIILIDQPVVVMIAGLLYFSILIFLGNLVPVCGSDGGGILASFVPKKIKAIFPARIFLLNHLFLIVVLVVIIIRIVNFYEL